MIRCNHQPGTFDPSNGNASFALSSDVRNTPAAPNRDTMLASKASRGAIVWKIHQAEMPHFRESYPIRARNAAYADDPDVIPVSSDTYSFRDRSDHKSRDASHDAAVRIGTDRRSADVHVSGRRR